MTEQCKGEGSIQKLVANKWKTVGIGQLILLKNKHNPTHVLLKLIRKKKNAIYMFQCKPKVKTNNKSLILKGTDTKKKQEFVLALRFDDNDVMTQFQHILDQLYRRTQTGSVKSWGHSRTRSTPPQTIKMELSQYAWDCELCTFRNEPEVFDCEVCKHPRPLSKQRHLTQDSIRLDSLPVLGDPVNTSISFNDMFPDTPNMENGLSQNLHRIDERPYDEKSESKESKEEEQVSTIKELICQIMNGESVASIKASDVENILLLCHDTFTDSETMLKTLLSQVNDANLMDATCRIRGVNLCESWIKKYWDNDFAENEQMTEIMYAFIDDLHDSQLPDSDINLLLRIKKVFEEKVEKRMKRRSTFKNIGKWIGDVDIPKNYDVMKDNSTQVIAEQITLMDFAIFQSITRREMTGQGWKKKDRAVRSPHLLAMIAQFNSISKWVQCVVLQQKNVRQRTQCIEKFIRIAVKLRELRNFSACCAVNFGLSANVLYRLENAWTRVSKKESKQFSEIQLIYKAKKNWELLRVLHKNAYAPSILHTGLFMQDLVNTDEGNEDKKKDGTVNLNKLRRTYNLIEQICMYQQSQYFTVKGDMILQEYLRKEWQKQALYNENKMYKISKIVQNKDAEGKEIEESDLLLIAW